MEYQELSLYNRHGGENFIKKNIKKEENNQNLNEDDRRILKVYKKKIIQQRNEIEKLTSLLKKHNITIN
jgi:hypothetical protein